MTLADKKIEEFRKKFCFKRKNETSRIKNMQSFLIEDWLSKALSEAEREGMKKAYNDCSNNGGELPIEFHKFTENKLKELEEEKCK